MPPAYDTLGEITGFLELFPPFSDLGGDALLELAGQAEIEYFPAGTVILAQEGEPAHHLYVVRRGAVELLDEGQVVDVLEEGESFGLASVLAELPPSLTARAREDTLCYLFAPGPTQAALSEPAGMRFVATTLQSRLERATARTHRATPWGTAHVGERARPALVCAPSDSIREVARRMTEDRQECAVIPLRDGFGLVADRDLRVHVVADGVTADAAVATIVDAPAPAVAPDRLALDALVDMLDADAEQLVVVDERGQLVGIVDQAGLLDLDEPSPLLLRQSVQRATDVDAVVRAVSDLPRLALRLLDANVAALDMLDVLTTATDAATRRLTELAIAELGEPPAPWAWLTLGSAARREQTLATDQDNGLAYDGEGPEVERYFARFAELMNDWLARCGYAECPADVMARSPDWRLSRTGWIELYESWLRMPTRRHVQLAMIGLDLRAGIGPLPIEHELDAILETVSRHQEFVDQLARTAVSHHPPLGFLRDLVVERSGEHVGTLDIKTGGVVPIVNLARLHALSAGSTAKRTIDRLHAAAARGKIPVETAQELEEAFVTVSRVRLEHQAAQLERGAVPDNHVDPHELPPLERRQLKEAFRAIERARKAVDTRTATRIP
ncbi:MAG TPA: putative nucleotidyltransferase substrate binding domain-containing protein [Gaiellaceae bacterium]|nr:putative nucleotidyltransferase substrate binding domain-containing protein [Gaiellaceae bacterium]